MPKYQILFFAMFLSVASYKDAEKKKQAGLLASEFSATLFDSMEKILNYNLFGEETLVDYYAVESELVTQLTGRISDQSSLAGILKALYDMQDTILSVNVLEKKLVG